MKHILILIVALLMLRLSAIGAEWTVITASSTALKAVEHTSKAPDDFWLHITLRNDSKVVQYVRGLRPSPKTSA